MSKRKGRKYERELIELLESHGCHVKDCHANAGISGRFDCDLLVAPANVKLNTFWDINGDSNLVEVEVKYSAKGRGFAKLYDAHLRGYGLGGADRHVWRDGMRTGGILAALEEPILGLGLDGEDWHEDDNCLNSFLSKAFKTGVSLVACRMARKPWIFIWRDRR